MRISREKKAAILNVVREMLFVPYSLYLFGSRTDDRLKGGDIDLLLVVSDSEVDAVKSLRYQILARLKMAIGDQKIDLAIFPDISMDPFYRMVKAGAVKLTSENNTSESGYLLLYLTRFNACSWAKRSRSSS